MSHITPIKTTMKDEVGIRRALRELQKESDGTLEFAEEGKRLPVSWEGTSTDVNFARLTIPGATHQFGVDKNKDGTFTVKYGMTGGGGGKLSTLVGAKYVKEEGQQGRGTLKCTRLEAIYAQEAARFAAQNEPKTDDVTQTRHGNKLVTVITLQD